MAFWAKSRTGEDINESVAARFPPRGLDVHLGLGDGAFGSAQENIGDEISDVRAVALVDIDADLSLDVVTRSGSGDLTISSIEDTEGQRLGNVSAEVRIPTDARGVIFESATVQLLSESGEILESRVFGSSGFAVGAGDRVYFATPLAAGSAFRVFGAGSVVDIPARPLVILDDTAGT